MIKIVKGNQTLTVSNAAYDNFFKGQGWEVASGKSKKDKKENAPVSGNEVVDATESSDEQEWDDQEWNDEEVTKPISEMNREELIEYAKRNKINIEGLNSTKQIRDAVKSHS